MKAAYTYANIKASWRATGVHPFNPDAVLVSLKTKHHNGLAAKHTSQPIAHTSPRSFLCYDTPHMSVTSCCAFSRVSLVGGQPNKR